MRKVDIINVQNIIIIKMVNRTQRRLVMILPRLPKLTRVFVLPLDLLSKTDKLRLKSFQVLPL